MGNNENGNGNGSGIIARWRGLEVRTRGELVYITIIIAFCFGVSALLLYNHSEAQDVAMKQLADNQKAILGAQEATTYVLTLSPEEREKLKLRMPDSLRDRVSR